MVQVLDKYMIIDYLNLGIGGWGLGFGFRVEGSCNKFSSCEGNFEVFAAGCVQEPCGVTPKIRLRLDKVVHGLRRPQSR